MRRCVHEHQNYNLRIYIQQHQILFIVYTLYKNKKRIYRGATPSQFCGQSRLKNWLPSLVDVTEAPLWQTKKTMLYNGNLNAEVMGRSFVVCAPTVFAEDHLSWLMDFLEEKINKGVEFGDEEMALQYDFIEILDEFWMCLRSLS